MKAEELKNEIKGIVPVQLLPYTEDDEVDIEGLKENTEFIADFAKDGDKDVVILANGSTTEFYANSVEEQKEVIKAVVESSGDTTVVAGTSQAGTKETIKLTQYAEEVGADGAMVVLPYYHTPTKEGMYRHYEEVADAVDIGIVVYNNPDVSGAWIDPNLMGKISKIDNIVAAKDNTPSAPYFYQMTRKVDPADMTLIDGLGFSSYVAKASFGLRCKGFVNTIGNFAPKVAYDLYEAVTDEDFKRAYEVLKVQENFWNQVAKAMETRETTSIIPGVWRTNYMYQSGGKAAMDLVGLNGGKMRLPMTDITDEEKEGVRKALENMEIL